MAFKGKSTIELRNAETGELEQRVEDENMVTNAVYNLINQSNLIDRTKTTISNISMLLNPLLQNCFSGLLLFEKSIAEDKNLIFPLPGNLTVGHAYDSTVAPDTFLGTINTTESKEINNGKGYRYVWDFPTDRGNGTIRSVALTSGSGGLCGLRVSEVTNLNTSLFTSPSNLKGSSVAGIPEYNAFSYLICDAPEGYTAIGELRPNQFVSLKTSNGATGADFYITTPQKVMGLVEGYRYLHERKQVATTVKMVSADAVTIYDGKLYSLYVYDNKIDVAVFDCSTLELVKEETLTVQDANFYPTSSCNVKINCFYKGFYYVLGSDVMTIYKINAEDISDYSTPFSLPVKQITGYPPDRSYFKTSIIGDKLYIHMDFRFTSIQWHFYCVENDELIRLPVKVGSSNSYPYLPVHFSEGKTIKPPYIIACRDNHFKLCIYTAFLSTINNLSTPVVKNETQTMKVTYEITEI